MLCEPRYHSHSGYANILIHHLTTVQPMNAENVTSHCHLGEKLGQFDCRAFRNDKLWEVWFAENDDSKGKRAQKRSTQKDDSPPQSFMCSLSPLECFFRSPVLLKKSWSLHPQLRPRLFCEIFHFLLLSHAKLDPCFSLPLSSLTC